MEELRLVYGMTIDLLVGGDINRNGVLDGNEKSSAGGTAQNTGLLDYTTVYSREPNVLADGTSLTNVNNFNSATEMESFFQNAGASSDETPPSTTASRATSAPGRPSPASPAEAYWISTCAA